MSGQVVVPTKPSVQWVPGHSEVKSAGDDVTHPPPSRAEVKEAVES
jgi:hypothetical protein